MAIDVAVVGAGAAGLGASAALRGMGLGVVVLEAMARPGGRAFTDESLGVPIDLGCTWLHSADENPLAEKAVRRGMTLVRRPTGRRVFLEREGRFAGAEEVAAFDAFMLTGEGRIMSEGRAGRDVAASTVLPEHPRWRPFLDWWIAAYSGADADECSTVDWSSYRDTGRNWPLLEGYGELFRRLAADEPVRLAMPVERIEWSDRGVRLTTRSGAVEARAAIVTVPPPRLVDGTIGFDPPLPAHHAAAAEDMPLGSAEKIVLAFRPGTLEAGAPFSLRMESVGFQIRPLGRDIASAYVGGRRARDLVDAGEDAMVDFATERLVQALGSGIRAGFVRGLASRWQAEPWILGGYSAARPGRNDARTVLAEPVGERLFFAGEATAVPFHTTAHGAWLDGRRAARRVADALYAR